MAIEVADVVAEYGSYYLNSGQNTSSLFKRLLRPSVTESFFNTVPTVSTRIQLGSSSMDRVLQAFQKQFTPTGTLTFSPRQIDLYEFKIDKKEFPDEIENLWLGFLAGEGINRAEWPFVRWMLEEHVFPKAAEDYELSEVWSGVYVAPTTGVVAPVGTACNGLNKQIEDGLTDGSMNLVTTGAPPEDEADFCVWVEEYVANIDKEYRKKIDFVFMNEDNELKYKRGKRKLYNTNYSQAADLLRIEDFPNAMVKGLPSMLESNKLWSTLPGNRTAPVKRSTMARPIVKDYAPREVSIFTDWWKTCTFPFPQAVYANDQD